MKNILSRFTHVKALCYCLGPHPSPNPLCFKVRQSHNMASKLVWPTDPLSNTHFWFLFSFVSIFPVCLGFASHLWLGFPCDFYLHLFSQGQFWSKGLVYAASVIFDAAFFKFWAKLFYNGLNSQNMIVCNWRLM